MTSNSCVGKMVVGNNSPIADLVGSLIITLLAILILLLIGEFLWNNVLVKVTTIFKPVTSVWQILGLLILVKLFCC
jgi:hypothetical protein